jgi:hypothetical protein
MSRTNGHRVDTVLLLGKGSRVIRIELSGLDLDVGEGSMFESGVGLVRLTHIQRARVEDLSFEVPGDGDVFRKAIVFYGDYEVVRVS